METPSVRVLVVGDSGVGKSALLRSICRLYSPHAIDNDKPPALWTTGCDVHVLLKRLEPEGREVFVEFLDVGGHRKYELSRGTFYHNVHGIMFVHDLSNAKSGEHLRNWSRELSTMQRLKGCVVPPTGHTHDIPTLADLPKLVVGNKKDLLPKTYISKLTGRMSSLEGQPVACLESSADPFAMDPSGVFETFVHQTVAFANREGSSMGLRPTTRPVDVTDSSVKVGLSSFAATLPPLPTGSSGVRSRWW